MEEFRQYHLSMGVVGGSLVVVGVRLLLAEPVFSVLSAFLAVGGVVVLLAAGYSHRTVTPAEFELGNLTWVSAFCAGVCFSGLLVVLLIPISSSPP